MHRCENDEVGGVIDCKDKKTCCCQTSFYTNLVLYESRWKINNIALTLQAHHVVSPPRVSIVVNKSVANSAQDFRVESKDGGWQRSLFLEEGQEDGEGDSGEATAVEDVEGEVGEGDSGEATAVEDVEGEVGEEEEGARIITG